MRRGDNIPPVSDYAQWNEDAERVWYEENKYDMEHWDEEIGDDDFDFDRFDADPYEECFDTEADARVFMARWGLRDGVDGVSMSDWGEKWYVEHWSDAAHVSLGGDLVQR